MSNMPDHTGIAKNFEDSDEGPTIIAIAGGTASGTSTLGKNLETALAPYSECISLDSFYQSIEARPEDDQEEVNWDHPQTLDWGYVQATLQTLQAGGTMQIPVYDFETAERSEFRTIEGGDLDYVIIEGLWAGFSTIRKHADVLLYIETQPWVRLTRRVERDIVERGESCLSTVRQFRDECQPMHERHVEWQKDHAHVIDGEQPQETVYGDAMKTLVEEGVVGTGGRNV